MSTYLESFIDKEIPKYGYNQILPCFENKVDGSAFSGIAFVLNDGDKDPLCVYFSFAAKKFVQAWNVLERGNEIRAYTGYRDDKNHHVFDFSDFVKRTKSTFHTPSLNSVLMYNSRVCCIFYNNDTKKFYEMELFVKSRTVCSVRTYLVSDLQRYTGYDDFAELRKRMPSKYAKYN